MKPAMQQLSSTLGGTRPIVHRELMKTRTWEQAEGSPLPLGATWIEEEQAFNFAICAEHAESVTLLFYARQRFGEPSARATASTFCATSQDASGIAGYQSPKSASVVTTHIRCRVRIRFRYSQLRSAEGSARPLCERRFLSAGF